MRTTATSSRRSVPLPRGIASTTPANRSTNRLTEAYRVAVLSFADPIHFWIESRPGESTPFKQNSRERPFPVITRNGSFHAKITKTTVAEHTRNKRLHFCNDLNAPIWLLCHEIDNKVSGLIESNRFAEPIRRRLGDTYVEPSRGGRGLYVFFRFDRRGLTRDQAVASLQALDEEFKSIFRPCVDGPKIDAIKGLPRKVSEHYKPDLAESSADGWEPWYNENWIDWGWSKTVGDHYLDARRNRPNETPVIDELEEWAFLEHSTAPAPCGWRANDTPDMAIRRLTAFLEWFSRAVPATSESLGIRSIPNQPPVVAATDDEAHRKLERRAADELAAAREKRSDAIEHALDRLYEELPDASPYRRKQTNKWIDVLADLPEDADFDAVRQRCFPRRRHLRSKSIPDKIRTMLDSGNPWLMARGCVMLELQWHGNRGMHDTCDAAMGLYETHCAGRDGNRDRKRTRRFTSAYRKAMKTFDPSLIGRDQRPHNEDAFYTTEDIADVRKFLPSVFSAFEQAKLHQELKACGASSRRILDDLALLYVVASKVIIEKHGGLPVECLKALEPQIAAWSGSKLRILLKALESRFLDCTNRRYQFKSRSTLCPDLVKGVARQYWFKDKALLPLFAVKFVSHELNERQRARYSATERANAAGPTNTYDIRPVILLPKRYWTT